MTARGWVQRMRHHEASPVPAVTAAAGPVVEPEPLHAPSKVLDLADYPKAPPMPSTPLYVREWGGR